MQLLLLSYDDGFLIFYQNFVMLYELIIKRWKGLETLGWSSICYNSKTSIKYKHTGLLYSK